MIIGLGIDLVKINRIKAVLDKYGDRFLRKIFTEEEITKKNVYEISGKFAVKESFVKALGTGFSKNVFFKDVIVLNNQAGKPYVVLSEKIIKNFNLQNLNVHVSISHDGDYAIAMTILERV